MSLLGCVALINAAVLLLAPPRWCSRQRRSARTFIVAELAVLAAGVAALLGVNLVRRPRRHRLAGPAGGVASFVARRAWTGKLPSVRAVRADLRNRYESKVSELSEIPAPTGWRCQVTHETDGTTRVALAGELDMAVAPAFRAELERAVTEGASVIVDLRELEFMDSSGMHGLAAADARARAMNARLVIAHPAGSVLRLLELTGMREALEVVEGSGPPAP